MLSLSPLTVLPCSPLEQIDAAVDAGFDAIGLRLVPTLDTDIDVLADPALMQAIKARLRATKLRVLEIQVVRIGPATDVAAAVPLLCFAQEIGARHLAVTSLPRSEWDPAQEAAVATKLRELCECAARYQVRPAIEFMAFRGIATLDDAVRIIGAVGHANIGICLDVLHLYRSGGDVTAVQGLASGLVSWVDVCDAPLAAPAAELIPAEARFNRLYPGEGELPLAALLAALPPYVPWSIEAPCQARRAQPPAGRARDAARHARALLAQVQTAR